MAATDFRGSHWTQRWLPRGMRPYAALARWDRPVGVWLLLLPGWWALFLAYPGAGSPEILGYFVLLFGIGAFLLRSFGCVVNDLLDRNLDRLVERTRDRPLASGQLSVVSAFVFAGILALMGGGILMLLPREVFILGVCSLFLVVAYPLMKRFFPWPQAFLGLTFNWGALMGWVAVRGDVSEASFCLYLGGFFWTLTYDTVYALLDLSDDEKAHIFSSARTLGNRVLRWVFSFLVLAFVCWTWAGYAAGAGRLYFLGLALAFAYGSVGLWRLEHGSSPSYLAYFVSHATLGKIVLLGAALDWAFGRGGLLG